VINSFTAQPPQVTVGQQCIALAWSTSNAISSIVLERSGTPLLSNLSASGQVNDCSFPAGTHTYALVITASQYYGPVSATQIVQAVAPPTATPTPTPTLSINPL
jgi:hypothetical protein